MYYGEEMMVSYTVNFGNDYKKLYDETVSGAITLLDRDFLALHSYNNIVAYKNEAFKELQSLYEKLFYLDMDISGEDGTVLYLDEGQFNRHIDVFNELQIFLEKRIQSTKEEHENFQKIVDLEDEELNPEMKTVTYFEQSLMDSLALQIETMINLTSNCRILLTNVFVKQE